MLAGSQDSVLSMEGLGSFACAFDVVENSLMYLVNHVIGNRPPIPLRRQGVRIPSGALKDNLPVALEQAKLPAVRNHVAVEVRCLDVLIQGQLTHRRRRRRNVEREQNRCLPMGYGLDEAASGEDAMADGSDA